MVVNRTDSRPDHSISLLSVGAVDDGVMKMLRSRLSETFRCDVRIHDGTNIPPETYNPQRKQYWSSRILDVLHKLAIPSEREKYLAITGVDLYVPQLNFVFGEAELEGHLAIISLARLSQIFYGLPEDRALFSERAVKEAVHELGHTFGLRHCPEPECVMHFSNSLHDTDRKKAVFCSRCQQLLEKEMGLE
jgi:archaemetzincin